MAKNKKPVIEGEVLKDINTLARLVGRFDKMQVYDIHGCHDSLLSFEIDHWRKDYSDFRKNLERVANHYPIVKEYVQGMNQILEKQNKYRHEYGLETVEGWLENERLRKEG